MIRIVSVMICSNCGTDNLNDAKYCIKCGTKLNEKVEALSPETRPQMDQKTWGISKEALPGFAIGLIIILIGITSVYSGNFVGMMENWGENFGEIMGNWGEDFGRAMGDWGESVGRFFADWGTSFGERIGASVLILIGFAILYYSMYGRTRA